MAFRSSVFKENVGVQSSQIKKGGVQEFNFSPMTRAQNDSPYNVNIEFRSSQDKLKSEVQVHKMKNGGGQSSHQRGGVQEFGFTSARALEDSSIFNHGSRYLYCFCLFPFRFRISTPNYPCFLFIALSRHDG